MGTTSPRLMWLAVIFATCLIVANITAGKLWDSPIGILTAGVFCFPLVYVIGDVVPEVYGWKAARQVIAMGFVGNLLAVGFFYLTIQAPYPAFWEGQDAFRSVLGFTPRLLGASFCGYLVGTHANAWVMVVMKRLTDGRWLWTRTITSTLIGEGLDTIAFITVAFYGTLPTPVMLEMMRNQWLFKCAYEAAATPLTYIVVGWFKRVEVRSMSAKGGVPVKVLGV